VHTRETLRFATERDLLVYLLQLLAAEPASPNDHPNPEVEADQ